MVAEICFRVTSKQMRVLSHSGLFAQNRIHTRPSGKLTVILLYAEVHYTPIFLEHDLCIK